MAQYTMTIGGAAVAGEQHFDVINPATGQAFAQAPECTRGQLEQAMEAASQALPAWRSDEAGRRRALEAAGDRVLAAAQDIGRVLTQEQGKPLKAAGGEVFGAGALLKAAAQQEIPVDVVQDDESGRIEIRRKPYGVVAAITPWNFPVVIAAQKLGPALLAGNTVVLKPSPFTPLSTLMLGEALREALPPGVVNVVSGGNQLGAWMTPHPTVRKISFTGSVATGKRIAAAAADDLKRVTLELGGNDPAIVLADVDPDQVAKKLFWSAFNNCGQVCIAVKRLYVAEPIFKPVLEAVARIARDVKVGDGLAPDTRIGPLNNRPQLERVMELVRDAREQGARVLAGGERLGADGFFHQPTVLSDLDDGARIVAEEQFGPALPVLPFRDVDDALERANRTHFGLGGSVWTGDLERGMDLASRLESGTGWVNRHAQLTPLAPFGGAKQSGIGYEMGRWGLDSFTQLQVVSGGPL